MSGVLGNKASPSSLCFQFGDNHIFNGHAETDLRQTCKWTALPIVPARVPRTDVNTKVVHIVTALPSNTAAFKAAILTGV